MPLLFRVSGGHAAMRPGSTSQKQVSGADVCIARALTRLVGSRRNWGQERGEGW